MKFNLYPAASLLKRLLVVCLLTGMAAVAVQAQSYTENFNSPAAIFTAGWSQQNLSSPIGTGAWFAGNPAVFSAYNGVDSAYIGANFSSTGNIGDISNWLFTPVRTYDNGHTFSFRTRTTSTPQYADRLQVRLSTAGASTNAGTTATSVGDFSTLLLDINPSLSATGYPNTWTQYTVTLSGLSGPVSGRIAFRYFVTNGGSNGSNSDYIGIDNVVYNVPVAFDAQLLSVDTLEYTIVPRDQQNPLPYTGIIRNNGGSSLDSVYLSVNVYNASASLVYSANSTVLPGLASGASANFSVPAAAALPSAAYRIEYTAKHAMADSNPVDDTLYNSILISPTLYARDNGAVSGGLGIGDLSDTYAYIGQQFTLYQPDNLDSVLAFFVRGYTGQEIAAVIWNMQGGRPNQIIGYTDTLSYINNSGGAYTLPMSGGSLFLPAGDFVVTLIEFDSTLQLGTTTSIFTPGTTWVDWSNNPLSRWANAEEFGFSRAFVIRPILGICPGYSASISSTPSTCSGATGTATLNISGGAGPFSYAWSNAATGMTATGLAAGTYTVTATDTLGCQVSSTIIISKANEPLIDTIFVQPPPCNGGDGTISSIITGGTAAYSYLWSNNATTSSIRVPAGSYTLTVTDAANCVVSTGPIVMSEPPLLTAGINSTPSDGSNGTATVTASGGTLPYSYAWSNGGVTRRITGLAIGSYTVTVTDANGCTVVSSTSVSVGIEQEIPGFAISAYPNPNDGAFRVFVNTAVAAEINIRITDIHGRTVFSDKAIGVTAYERNVTFGSKASGIYFLQVSSGEKARSYKIEVRP